MQKVQYVVFYYSIMAQVRLPVIFGYLRPVLPTPWRTNDFNRGVGPSIPGKSLGL
jgi:hypothetical protein